MTILTVIAMVLLAQVADGTPQSTDLCYAGFLRPNPRRTPLTKEEGQRIQEAHMANIRRMAANGNLVSAGPFDDTPVTISGIFILKASSKEEAQKIANEDPTVVEHRNTMDVHMWRAPAGIGAEYFQLHKADPKTPEGMGLHPLAVLYRGPSWKPGNHAVEELTDTLHAAGKLGAAGPIEGEEQMVGLLIFNRIAPEEAMKAIDESTAVKAGILRPEHHKMYSAEHVMPWRVAK